MIRFSRTNGHPQAKSFEFTRQYIDDLISVNNPRFDKDIEKIYPSELTLKNTTLADGKVAYLDRQIEIRDRQLVMSLYDKRDDIPIAIHNYPHLDSNIPYMPTYGVYISQLIRFTKACDSYSDFLTCHQRLVSTLMRQGFTYNLLCRKFQTVLSFSLWLYLSFNTPNLSLNTYARASAGLVNPSWLRPHPPWVVGAVVAFTDLDFRLHWYLSHSFQLETCFILNFFFKRGALVFFSKTCEKSGGMCACVLIVLWVKVRMCRNACEWACGRGENFFFFLSSCVCAGMT